MKTLHALSFLIIIAPSIASAELWIRTDGESIVSRYSGDCMRAGFCSENNSNVQSGWREVPKDQFDLSGSKYAKFDGANVVEMNTVEKAAIDILEANAEQARQIEAHNALVEQAKAEVDNPTSVSAMLNTCISAITTDEIRKIKGGNPNPSKTDAQLKATVKGCLDSLKR